MSVADRRLELNGCIVRSWRANDVASMATHANDCEIWINLRDRFPHPYTVADAEAYIGGCLLQSLQTRLAIEVDGEACGGIAVEPGTDVERTSAEVGYWLGRRHWGRGIMTEALIAVRDDALARLPLTRLFALPFAWNDSSCRVLEKAGFVLEGRLRKAAIKDGRITDQLMYAYVAPD